MRTVLVQIATREMLTRSAMGTLSQYGEVWLSHRSGRENYYLYRVDRTFKDHALGWLASMVDVVSVEVERGFLGPCLLSRL